MGKQQKYSRVASNDEDEPLPVRQSGQSAIGVLWQTAANDLPIAKQFRPKKGGDELWVEMAAKMPSCRTGDARVFATHCVLEWARWIALLMVPAAKVALIGGVVGLLLVLNCSSAAPNSQSLRCANPHAIVVGVASLGFGTAALAAVVRVLCAERAARARADEAGQDRPRPMATP